MGKPFILGVSSQKGGVGKTTVSVNLAIALREAGYKVLLVDGDTTNPSAGFHLGIEKVNIGYSDLLYGKADLNDVIVVHASSGIHVIPGTISMKRMSPSQADIPKLGNKISKSSYDFVVFDTAPGFVEEDLSTYYDEALILTTPEMTACTSSIRLAHEYDQANVKHNLLVNRIRNRKYEISIHEIEEISEGRVVGALPEDEIVPISVSEHIPAYMLDINSKFSKGISRTSRKYATKDLEHVPVGRSNWLWDLIRHIFGLQ